MICDSITCEDVTQLLQEGRCSSEFIQKFLTAMETKTEKDLLRMLRGQRICQLERLHEEGKKLDQLDFLRDMLEKQFAAGART